MADDLFTNFNYIDKYLAALNPLYVFGDYKVSKKLSGSEIESYIANLYTRSPYGKNIKFTPNFRNFKSNNITSFIFPIFINLIDNALYWVAFTKEEFPEIEIDYKDGCIYIKDKGPGIPAEERELVFQQGYSKKPNGFGLGLFIVRDLMKEIGWTIEIINSKIGVCFKIKTNENY